MLEKKFNFNFYGMPRSGSTILVRIIYGLFGYAKTETAHELIRILEPKIITYRDFRDITTSYWRITSGEYNDKGDLTNIPTKEDVISHATKTIGQINVLNSVDNYCSSNNVPVLYLRYEDFWNDYTYLFDAIQNFIQVPIETSVREELTAKINIKTSKKFMPTKFFSTF